MRYGNPNKSIRKSFYLSMTAFRKLEKKKQELGESRNKTLNIILEGLE